jgi:hypothetical protein
VIQGVALIWKIKTGLECCGCQLARLPKETNNTVLMQYHDKRRAALEIVIADSSSRIFSAFASVYGG